MYRKTLSDHGFHFQEIYQVLKQNELYTKLSKCEFDKSKIDYLDHNYNRKNINNEWKDKNMKMKKWKTPADQIQLKSFLQFTRFYLRFLKGFARLIQDFTTMLGKV